MSVFRARGLGAKLGLFLAQGASSWMRRHHSAEDHLDGVDVSSNQVTGMRQIVDKDIVLGICTL